MTTLAAAEPLLESEYRRRTPGSAKLYAEACQVLPSGVTHDSRAIAPYPIYAARALGPRKWDVDGNEYVDYYGGHGSLLLGHSHPLIVEAVGRQLQLGTHFGASHEAEVRWGQLVQRLVPCAERVRFTSSGTEASHLAIRLARAFTGKTKVLRYTGHFHGWHDQVVAGVTSHFDGSVPIGVLPALVEHALVLPSTDVSHTVSMLESRDDIAAVIVEPSGGSWGAVPLPPGFLEALREVTRKRGVVLIFDEVITGFRWSRGGAQAYFSVTPDMCVLGKIIAGGLPGGAIGGKREIFDQLDIAAAKSANREKIGHQGTYNANPLSAVAGVAMLTEVEREDICERACSTAVQLRAAMRAVLVEEDVPWGIYGERSTFHIFVNPVGLEIDPATFDPLSLGFKGLRGTSAARIAQRLRIAMLANGVDLMSAPGGMVSAVHTEREIEQTAGALRASVRWMKTEGDIRA